MTGPLALIGGGEFADGCSFDADLLAASGGSEVVVLATASAYERPQLIIDQAHRWFETLGARIEAPPVFTRRDAYVDEHIALVRSGAFIYLTGGSPMHLRSVLKDSPLFDAIVQAWEGGAVLAGSGAGADVLCDPMVDPRGGAFTVGLGVVDGVAVIPRYDTWSPEKVHRTVEIAPAGVKLVGIPLRTALVSEPGGTWRTDGVGEVDVFVDHRRATLADL